MKHSVNPADLNGMVKELKAAQKNVPETSAPADTKLAESLAALEKELSKIPKGTVKWKPALNKQHTTRPK